MTYKLKSVLSVLTTVALGVLLLVLRVQAQCNVPCSQRCIEIPGYKSSGGSCFLYCLQGNCTDVALNCNLCDPVVGNTAICCDGSEGEKCCPTYIEIWQVLHNNCNSLCGNAAVARHAVDFDNIQKANYATLMYFCETPVSGACPKK